MQTNDKEIMEAIARTTRKTQAEINNISRDCKTSPHLVERFYNGSPLSLMEIKQFVAWRSRLPDENDSADILYHGVGAMKTLFKMNY
jgi:hypothetical protein